MIKKIKAIEQALMVLYNELEGLFPKMHCLNFSVTHTNRKRPSYLYGFIHIESKAYVFNRINDLVTLVGAKIKKNQILYYNFDGLRKALK